MMRGLLEIGPIIDREWRALNYDEIALPGLAADVLSRSDAWHAVTIEEISEWILSGKDVAPQFLDGFGQPNLRLYSNHKFRVELLFWFEATTAIHEHAFSGAFGVVVGSSIHSEFGFRQSKRLCAELLLGELDFLSSELLTKGDFHPINPGRSYVHALFHLDFPSVSIVIRTHDDMPYLPQMRFVRPGLAEASHYAPYPQKTALAFLQSSARIGGELYRRNVRSTIRNFDVLTAFRAAWSALRHHPDDEQLAQHVLEDLADRDPDLANMLPKVVESERRDQVLIAMRNQVKDPDQRFLLALLLNVPDRENVLRLISKRFPDDAPEKKAFFLLQEMSEILQLPLRKAASDILEVAVSSADLPNFIERAKRLDATCDVQVLERIWIGLSRVPALSPLFA